MAHTTESRDLKLSEIIDGIYSGDYQLPEFQRDYVWKDQNIKSLFESVLSSHPIGTILVLEINKEKPLIAWTNFSEIFPSENRTLDYKKEDKDPPSFLVLDGQQRLTSLSHITHGNSKNIWYLSLSEIKEKWEENDCPSSKDEIKEFIDQELDLVDYIKKGKKTDDPIRFFRGKSKRLPLTLLKDKNTLNAAKDEVRDAIAEKISEKRYELKYYNKLQPKESREELEEIIEAEEAWKSFLGELLPFLLDNYFDFKIPTVVVSKEMGITGVCKVFTKINTTGIQLGAFDLTVAVLYPQNVSLKIKFDEAMDSYPLLKVLDNRPKRYVLQNLALWNDVSPKTSHLPEVLKPKMFEDHWAESVEALDEACKMLDKYCGSELRSGSDRYLCYSPLLPIVANVIYTYPIDVKDKTLNLLRINKLRAWYFGAGLSGRYGEGSDDKQKRDKVAMLEWFASGSFDEGLPEWLNKVYGDTKTGKSGAVGKTILSLLNLKQPKDLFREDRSVGPQHHDCDIHHIFPRAAMRKRIMDERKIKDKTVADKILKSELNVDTILNQTWLLSTTNREIIRDRLPSDYIGDLAKEYGGGDLGVQKVADLLRDHCIGEKSFQALLEDDYNTFIEERQKDFTREFLTTGKIPHILDSEPEELEEVEA